MLPPEWKVRQAEACPEREISSRGSHERD